MPARPPRQSGPPADAPVFTVGRLNREARQLLEGHFASVWVSGEISRFTHHGSGHMYFDLKDADASISCAMFRGSQRGLRFKPGGGMQVIVRGRVSIYESGGRYQLIVEHMEEAGEGLLRRQFEELKARLQAEGLFAEADKQPLPAVPRTIGVVTSPTGAAIRDILHVLRRRYPAAEVIVYPARVQGDGAREEIATAIATANARADCDVLIVARGGGSLEDLWAFNEEIVARAIHASEIPVIAGVGHEIDFTIADLVADVRAPTPSGAAELVVPDRVTLTGALRDTERRATLAMARALQSLRSDVAARDARLRRVHPGAVLRELQQKADELHSALSRHLLRLREQRSMQVTVLQQRLRRAAPAARVAGLRDRKDAGRRRLALAIRHRLETARRAAAALSGNLHAVSPLATLERGYAIVRLAGQTAVLRDAGDVRTGDEIEAQLARGSITATVTGTGKTGKA